ncbi:MAG: serine protease [Clostridia bacterium]|nr:serine protease [Clostridia bacterium]
MKIRKTLLLAGLLACFLTLSGCGYQPPVGISAIRKTATDGLVDTYTVYYTNGKTDTFTVKNGEDGVNGRDGEDGTNATGVTVEDLYNAYVEEYGEITYAEFLDLYLSGNSSDVSTTVANCLRSCVKVYAEFQESDGMGGMKDTAYTGGGVIYELGSNDTYLITNYHVVHYPNLAGGEASENIHCYLYGSESAPYRTEETPNELTYDDYAVPCTYVGGSIVYDIAVLKVNTADILAINPDVCEVTLAEEYHVGQTAIAIGNPNSNGISVTKGVVSVENENISLSLDGTYRDYRCIRIDTPLYHGNSGGGLFNDKGQLFGITNAGEQTDQNINYAIPFQIFSAVYDGVLEHYTDGVSETNGVCKTTIGVTVHQTNSKYVYDSSKGYGRTVCEVLVNEVVAGGKAAMTGVRAGDVITAIVIDGVEYAVEQNHHIADALLHVRVGSVISIKYRRGGAIGESTPYTLALSDLVWIE